ncbi:hypothetical protein [Limnobaculum xujianqingii]|uniref:hypothetical protein n=1 Tax=Limnobaculum xujianqingii TaxID=2738837 RepID=UPI00112B9E54|nr:hypothetical protein [Limnobaculum xujianqingii]
MDRKTSYRDGEIIPVQIAANTVIYAGNMVCTNAAGFAVLASTTTGLTTVGMATEFIDNRGGANGDAFVLVRRGKAFNFANSSSAPVSQALVGKSCYVADSQTVAATGDIVAGKVLFIDADGIWVEI